MAGDDNGAGDVKYGLEVTPALPRRFGSLEALVAEREQGRKRTSEAHESGNDPALRAVTAYFADPRNRAVVVELLAAGVRPMAPAAAVGKVALTGKTFVLTGSLPTLTRGQATEKISAAGGKVAGSVSRATHLVVMGTEPGAKHDQAKALGVAVIDETELLQRLAER